MNKKGDKNNNVSIDWNSFGIFLILTLLVIVLTCVKPVFLSFDNLLNVVRQVSMVSIIGIGMTFVLISGEIDLSVGSIAALAGIVATYAMRAGINVPVSLFFALLATTLCGSLNGFFLTVCRIPSFIVTMGMLNIARGIVLVITNSYPITGLPDSFAFIGKGYLGPIPFPVIIMMACYLIGMFVFKYTKFGRNVYAIGGNSDAARLSGITVKSNKIIIFMISGFVSGITGIILSSRMFSGQPSAGSGMELDAIAACVIGGTSTTGGKGRIWGTLLGALIMGIINNGMNLIGISTNWQLIVKGAIIIIAVGIDQIKKD
jgi:ribose/xylose/arabinose/galactoside ABC-type transport system permease subunit